MSSQNDNMRGAILMMASMASFTFGDVCVKALGGTLPLSQILVIRGAVAALFILGLALRLGHFRLRLPRRDLGLITLRSSAEVGAAYFFLNALIHMPIANVTALLQMLPLTVTLGGALFFAEPVGWRRWGAIGIGFAGMLLIVRPGTDGFDAWSIYALIAVACVTVRDLSTRRISKEVPSLTVTLAAAVFVLLFALVWSLGQDWSPVTGRSALLLAGSSGFIVCGYIFSVMVMRVGEVGFVAPFRYTGLIWALLLGWVVFGDWPENLTLIGAVLIVGMGSFSLWRETQIKRRKSAEPLPR